MGPSAVVESDVLVSYHSNEEHVIIPDGITEIADGTFGLMGVICAIRVQLVKVARNRRNGNLFTLLPGTVALRLQSVTQNRRSAACHTLIIL